MTTYSSEPGSGTTDTGATGYGTTDTSAGATSATDQARETASTAADQSKHVASTARDEARNVAGTAADQARNVLGDARQQVATQMNDQATTQRDNLAQTLRTLGDDLQQMVEQGPGQGMATDLAREVSDRVRALSSHLEGREPGQLLDEARDFARRRPGTFLLGALAAGVVAGRTLRATADGAAAASLAEPGGTGTSGTGTGYVGSHVGTGPLGTSSGAAPLSGAYDTPATSAPTMADPAPSTDPTTTAMPGSRTQDAP